MDQITADTTDRTGSPSVPTASRLPRQPRKTGFKDWVPDQPGAWAMALLPALAGLIAGAVYGRLTFTACWLLVCWILCYCVEFTAARWLKSRFARRYLPPTAGYAIVLAVAGIPFVVMHPGILAWAPIYIVLAAVAFLAAWLRRERSLWANATAIIAACLMPMLTFCYGVDTPVIPYVNIIGLVLAVCFAAVQFGSVLFVKTMIRERGNRAYLAASWIWHVLLLAWWGPSGSVPLIVLAVILLVRAVALPLVARRRRIRPMVTGIVECMTSLASFICILLT